MSELDVRCSETLQTSNCMVCGSLSSGKSSFVNAILGRDILPVSCCHATTKLTSVYIQKSIDVISGLAQRFDGEHTEWVNNVDTASISAWNNADEVARILLRVPASGIDVGHANIIVHEIPSTSNYVVNGDDILENFLANVSPNIIIYVADPVMIGTNDEHILLKKILEYVSGTRKVQVLFALNKCDSLECSGESIELAVKRFSEFLTSVGFIDLRIYPVSLKAASLIRRALKGGDVGFSEREIDEFSMLLRQFTRRLDLSGCSLRPADAISTNTVIVDGETYDTDVLRTALGRTGICALESEIEKCLS